MKILKVEPYSCNIQVYMNKEELRKYLKKEYSRNCDKVMLDEHLTAISNCEGYSMMIEDDGYELILLLPVEYSDDLSDHELLHMTWFICEIVDIPLNFSTQEHQTYLFTYLKRELKKLYAIRKVSKRKK